MSRNNAMRYRTLKLVRIKDLKTGYLVDCRPLGLKHCGVLTEIIDHAYGVKTLVMVNRSPFPEMADVWSYLHAANELYIPVIKRDSEGRLVNDQI